MLTRLLALAVALSALTVFAAPGAAQSQAHPRHHSTRHRVHHNYRHRGVSHPKSATGKTNQFSKNVNHETNRESKDFNHTMNRWSKNVNHAFQGKNKKKPESEK